MAFDPPQIFHWQLTRGNVRNELCHLDAALSRQEALVSGRVMEKASVLIPSMSNTRENKNRTLLVVTFIYFLL